MAVSITYPDKILAGLHQSYTVTSDEGEPKARILVGGREIPSRVIVLGPPKTALESTTTVLKYKVTFLLPDESAGGTMTVQLQAGGSKVEDSKPIVES